MNFREFAADHGLIIDRIDSGRWVRVPTVNHPHKKNGAYFFDGDYAHLQDWATMDRCVSWREDRPMTPYDLEAQRKRMEASRKESLIERRKLYLKAAQKAATMISSARADTHPYLNEKGFAEATALVLDEVQMKNECGDKVVVDNVLLIPMRDVNTNDVLGVQQIFLFDNEWQKKMIFGMRAKGAVFRIGNKTSRGNILAEGYATSLSIKEAIDHLRLNLSVICCFSAGNMEFVASRLIGKVGIFADNDASGTGERAARNTMFPWVMAETVGYDANDVHMQNGIFTLGRIVIDLNKKMQGICI
jgi:putative DNA primase/helicase